MTRDDVLSALWREFPSASQISATDPEPTEGGFHVAVGICHIQHFGAVSRTIQAPDDIIPAVRRLRNLITLPARPAAPTAT